MNRIWLGVGLLVVFFAFGLWSAFAVDAIYEPITQQLEAASAAALAGDLSGGAALAREAQAIWHRYWRKTASLSNHAPMDEIDALFLRLETFAKAGSTADFAANCAQLSGLVEACAEAHRLTWWNLL